MRDLKYFSVFIMLLIIPMSLVTCGINQQQYNAPTHEFKLRNH